MINISKALAALAVSLLVSMPAQAALLYSTGQVANLRIEGSAGFIGLSQPFPASSTCGSGTRVWVDMNSALGLSVYATAMLAFATKQTVVIRADDGSEWVFSECRLYDIYVAQ